MSAPWIILLVSWSVLFLWYIYHFRKLIRSNRELIALIDENRELHQRMMGTKEIMDFHNRLLRVEEDLHDTQEEVNTILRGRVL